MSVVGPPLRVVPYGDDALLLEADDARAIAPWAAHARGLRDSGTLHVTEVVPGARTVVLDGVGGPQARDDLAEAVLRWRPEAVDRGIGALVQIDVVFDGPDLDAVAAAWGVDVAEVPGLVCGAELTVAFCGFAPGFAYLARLGPEGPMPAVPRLETPRTRVPAGSVAFAGEFAGVYPRESPGGWRIVGTAVDAVLWDLEREEPALLTPGTRVRFVDAGPDR